MRDPKGRDASERPGSFRSFFNNRHQPDDRDGEGGPAANPPEEPQKEGDEEGDDGP